MSNFDTSREFQDITPRPVPSPHPSSSQNSYKPFVPDISIMDVEKDGAAALVKLFDDLLGNDDDSASSVEIPRKSIDLTDTNLKDYEFLTAPPKRKINRAKRTKNEIPCMYLTGKNNVSYLWDDMDISIDSDQRSTSLSSIRLHSNDFPLSVKSSTPLSYPIRRLNVDQFSPIPEESLNGDIFDEIFEALSPNNLKTKEDESKDSINYSDSVKNSQKQNYHRKDVSFQMNQLAEKYLPKTNSRKNEMENYNSNDSTYSIATENYLIKHELVPKNYKVREKHNINQMSIATRNYMERHGLINNNLPTFEENDQSDEESFQFNIKPKTHNKR